MINKYLVILSRNESYKIAESLIGLNRIAYHSIELHVSNCMLVNCFR